jgi:hypothetical protein
MRHALVARCSVMRNTIGLATGLGASNRRDITWLRECVSTPTRRRLRLD